MSLYNFLYSETRVSDKIEANTKSWICQNTTRLSAVPWYIFENSERETTPID